ncbi:leucokinin [Drosophila serrata]|uniref:leucokinin n=1 Tax=Drosophila serrata TaxID=7274 RepID=UPI000A1CFA01|nr:leucokinin [Drosophila serrata]
MQTWPLWILFLFLAIGADGASSGLPASGVVAGLDSELGTCELQLSKYRRFILQAILSFEDVCDAYNSRPGGGGQDSADEAGWLFRHYAPPPTSQRGEIWAFFRLLMAQFSDADFATIVRDAVIERCRIKSQLQRDEKRNSVVLGKKQRFHSWGGKRSPEPPLLPDY